MFSMKEKNSEELTSQMVAIPEPFVIAPVKKDYVASSYTQLSPCSKHAPNGYIDYYCTYRDLAYFFRPKLKLSNKEKTANQSKLERLLKEVRVYEAQMGGIANESKESKSLAPIQNQQMENSDDANTPKKSSTLS